MATKKKQEVDLTWVHRAVGIAAPFSWQDDGRSAVIDSTTVIGQLSPQEGKEPVWIVRIDGTETESRGEYSWGFQEYWRVQHGAGDMPVCDEASDEEVAEMESEGK